MFVLHQINLKYQNKKMLFLLYQSKVKQREIIKKYDIKINNHQNMILSCLTNVKNLYQESHEIKNYI